jgi:hypothetical protein
MLGVKTSACELLKTQFKTRDFAEVIRVKDLEMGELPIDGTYLVT